MAATATTNNARLTICLPSRQVTPTADCYQIHHTPASKKEVKQKKVQQESAAQKYG
jgi:hypothetical protein